MTLPRGSVVVVSLDPTVGHEQRGIRPCVIVSDTEVNEERRFPVVCVVPLTGTPGEGALYPAVSPGESGLRKTSYALVDQPRSIDKRRVTTVCGAATAAEMDGIDRGLRLFLAL